MPRTVHWFVGLALVCLSSCLLAGCGGAAVSAPSEYKVWNAKDRTFRLEYPADWTAEGGGKHGVQWARFQKGTAEISVDVNVSDSLVGDIVESGQQTFAGPLVGDLGEEDEELAPVAIVHNLRVEQLKEANSSYQEEPAVTVKSGLGDTRKGAFTIPASFGRTMRGYHVTALSRDRGIILVCQCRESDWKTLQPAFDRIIESLGYGQ